MLDVFFPLVFLILGAVFGSFANVIIMRLPKDESLLPSSHCRSCQKKISWFHNVPIFAWIYLRGQCRSCGAKIPLRYLLVEVLMACLFWATYHRFGLSWFTLEVLIFVFGAVTASFIDIDHMILPDEFTLGGALVALLGALLNPERLFLDAVLGFLLGGGFLFAVGYIYWFFRGREGMGGGDIKLLAWIGALLGLVSIPFILLVSATLGTIHGLLTMWLQKKEANEGFPFGPAIVVATFIYLFIGPGTIFQWLFPSLSTS